MSIDAGAQDPDAGARRLSGAMLEHAALSVERMPGLAAALDRFVAEAARSLESLLPGGAGRGAFENVRATSLSLAVADCGGLTAAIYASAESQARVLIALDERIDDLLVAAIFGPSVRLEEDDPPLDETRARTTIETALIEEFSRALGRALEAAFAPLGRLELTLESLVPINDAFPLARRDSPAAAARFTLPIGSGAFEGLLLLPQALLAPLRKELERGHVDETPPADGRWSRLLETEVKQARLPLAAILDELPMSLGDVANLRVGKILPLESNGFGEIRLQCSGRNIFVCRLGQGEGRYRLEIESPIPQEQDNPAR